MEKNISDYLHLYLGCDYWTNNSQGNLNEHTLPYVIEMCDRKKDVQLHLRPLSSMTEEEEKELDATKVFVRATPVHMIGNMQWTPESYRWAFSKSFDLFSLIESGLAIDKTKLPTHA